MLRPTHSDKLCFPTIGDGYDGALVNIDHRRRVSGIGIPGLLVVRYVYSVRDAEACGIMLD